MIAFPQAPAPFSARRTSYAVQARIERIDFAEAKPFIERWHYSGVVPTGKNVFFGWFVNGRLYATACYGTGVNPFQAALLAKEMKARAPSSEWPVTQEIYTN